jgi:hypothetical protein
MLYFKRTDAVDVRQVVADEEKVMIYGVYQTAYRGDWVVTRHDTFSSEITLWGDDGFKKQFIQLPAPSAA